MVSRNIESLRIGCAVGTGGCQRRRVEFRPSWEETGRVIASRTLRLLSAGIPRGIIV